MSLGLLLSLVFAIPADPVIDLPPTEPFEAPKYGVATRLPKDWPLAVREKDDRVFVAVIPQDDPNRPGVAACELGLAPESLEEYRTRIDSSAKQRGRQNGKLASNRVIKDASGERLETIWEFHPSSGGFWHEVTVRVVAHRQLYSFILNVEDARYAAARPGVRRPGRRHAVLAAQHRRRPAGEAGQPLGPARVQVRPRPARGLEPGPRPQRGRAPLRQRSGPRRLVRQRPGAGPPAGQGRPQGSGEGASRPAEAGRPELRGPLVPGRLPGQGQGPGPRDRRPHQARPVLDDRDRAAVPRQPVRLRGQVHPRVEAVRRPRPADFARAWTASGS